MKNSKSTLATPSPPVLSTSSHLYTMYFLTFVVATHIILSLTHTYIQIQFFKDRKKYHHSSFCHKRTTINRRKIDVFLFCCCLVYILVVSLSNHWTYSIITIEVFHIFFSILNNMNHNWKLNILTSPIGPKVSKQTQQDLKKNPLHHLSNRFLSNSVHFLFFF